LPETQDTRKLAIELRLALGEALSALGENGRYFALLREAEALSRALDDQSWLGRVLAEMARAFRLTGDYEGAVAVGQQALACATALDESVLQAQASQSLGQAYFATGDLPRAAELLHWNVETMSREPARYNTDLRIRSLAWLTLTWSTLGEFAAGLHSGQEAMRLVTLGNRGSAAIGAHSCLGLLYLTKGELEPAIRVLEQGLALCHASGNRNWLHNIMAGLGYAAALQGRIVEGRALLEESIRESIRMGQQTHSRTATMLSEVCCLAGRSAEAWQHAHQGLTLSRQQKARGSEAQALRQLGMVHAHAVPPDAGQAAACYQQALAMAEELGMRPLVARCQHSLGELYCQLGQGEQARMALSAAIALYRSMDMTFWLPQAEAALAQVA
jgi:tetratricopeptide (TPR) repeat protein